MNDITIFWENDWIIQGYTDREDFFIPKIWNSPFIDTKILEKKDKLQFYRSFKGDKLSDIESKGYRIAYGRIEEK